MTALMFRFVYGAILRGLPFPEENRILRIGWIQPSAPDAWESFGHPLSRAYTLRILHALPRLGLNYLTCGR